VAARAYADLWAEVQAREPLPTGPGGEG